VFSGLVLAFGFAAACGSDDSVKRVGEPGGAGGEPGAAGAGPVSLAGGSSNPMAGQGSGAQPAAGQGGAGPSENTAGAAGLAAAGQSAAGAGGELTLPQAGAAGAGGSSGLSCPNEIGTFSYQCAEVAEFWSPVWNPEEARFELDPSNLPFPIASGTATYFYSGVDGQFCGNVQVVVEGNLVTVPVAPGPAPVSVRLTNFKLVDVCGDAINYDAVGAPACFDLRSTVSDGPTPLDCNSTLTATCPAACD